MTAQRALVIILAGSKADEKHFFAIASACKELGLDVAVRIGSAHKTAEHVLAMLRAYETNPRPKVYITVAGRSNALSGFVDGFVSAPVIACPPPSDAFGGVDVFSSLRMPSGISACVVLDPGNAALLAAKMCSLIDPTVLSNVKKFQALAQKRILDDDATHNG